MIPFDDTKNIIRLLVVVVGGFILSVTIMVIFNESGRSKNESELINYFEPTQIAELNRLTDFVISELTTDCEGKQTDCLKNYFNQFEDSDYDFELTGISKSKQNELLNSLSESTYNDIWSKCKGSRPTKNGRVNIESICPNANGQFANFLINYCNKNERLAGYGNAFKQVSSYSPSMNAQLVLNPESFDFNSQAELLLISIHLLTLNNEDKIVESVPNR